MASEASHREAASLSTYLRVLRRRKWIVIACAVLVPATAYFLSARQPAQYQASADVYLSSQDLAGALTGISAPYVDEARLADTQAMLAHVPLVAQRAITLSGVEGVTAGRACSETPASSRRRHEHPQVHRHEQRPRDGEATGDGLREGVHDLPRGARHAGSPEGPSRRSTSRLTQLEANGDGQLSTRDQPALEGSAACNAPGAADVEDVRDPHRGATRVQIAPTPRKNAMLGLILGIVLGLGLAFAVDALDTRVRSATEVGERLGLPQLARVPPPPKALAKDDQLVMIAQPTGTSAEAFRMLRTNLDFATLEIHGARTILVTSAVEKEGKSTTSANLAIAEARAGRRVALVDLDLRVPYLDRFFGLLHAEGITDVALGNTSLRSALKRIDLDTGTVASSARSGNETNGRAVEQGCLDVLVSGPRPPDPGEFVGGRRLAEILAILHEDYDLVIVDTPPVLRVGDTMTLSSHADGILVVTKLNVIRRPMLTELRRTLGTAPTRKLGYVATGSRDKETGGYGYGYGYGGYGYGEPKAEKPAPRADQPSKTPPTRRLPASATVPEESERT